MAAASSAVQGGGVAAAGERGGADQPGWREVGHAPRGPSPLAAQLQYGSESAGGSTLELQDKRLHSGNALTGEERGIRRRGEWTELGGGSDVAQSAGSSPFPSA